MKPIPRVKFCWNCGRKLQIDNNGNWAFTEQYIDGHFRIMHKQCAKSPDLVQSDAELLAEKEEQDEIFD